MTFNQLIGQRIRYLRTKLKLSGEKFGARLTPYLGEPWSRQTVYEAETGRRDFRIEEIFALASAGKVTVQFFLAQTGRTSSVEWQGGSRVKLLELAELLREPGQPTGKAAEVVTVRRMLKEATAKLAGAEEYLKFIGDPEDADAL